MTPSKPNKGMLKNILAGAGCILIGGIIIAAISDSGKVASAGADKEKEITQKTEPAAEPAVKTEEKNADTQKEDIISKLKAQAKRDWPNDYSTQEFWVNEQIGDYEYMKTIDDSDPIKKKACRDWPLDFSTQKYWYDEQVAAKERIK